MTSWILLIALANAPQPADAYRIPSASHPTSTDPWWHTWDDPSLREWLVAVAAENRDLAIAHARSRQSHALRTQARAGLLPDISATLSGSIGPARTLGFQFGFTGQGGPNIFLSGRASIGLNYQIDLTGRQILGYQAAKRNAEAAAEQVRASAANLAVLTTATYVDWVANQERIVLTRAQVDAVRTLLEVVRERFAQGEATALEVLQQEQQLRATEAQLPPHQATLWSLERALRVLAARRPGQDSIRAASGLATPGTRPSVGRPYDLLENRPDLSALQKNFASAKKSASAEFRQHFPTLTLTADTGWQAFKVQETNTQRTWSVGAALNIPIFSGGANTAAVRTAFEEATVARDRLYQAYLDAIGEVEQTYHQDIAWEEAFRARSAAEEAAHKTYRESRRRYAQGILPFIDVLASQTGWQNAQLQTVGAHASWLQARLNFFAALGGTWTRKTNAITAAEHLVGDPL